MALKVGILGAGHMGSVHAGILARDDRVKIAAVADLLPEKREALAQRVGGDSFPDVDSILDSGIEVLYITTPNTTHAVPTIKALQRGVHVFCEKPFATSVEEAEKILEAFGQSKVVYQGGHNRRFAPNYRFVKERIEQGFTPFLANIKMNDGDLKDPPWLSDRKKTGGFLYETTIHLLDLALWLMGDAVEVRAVAKSNLYPDLVDWAILMTFDQERMGVLTSSGHASWHLPTERVEIVGDHASLITEGLDVAIHSKGLAQPVESVSFAQLPNESKWGYVQEDDAFIASIMENRPSSFSVEEGLKIVRLIDACYRSAETGKAEPL
jgi:myo-inositol 2-dehydrogenase/D-chiro-inositol 1-dehydrogenase